MSLKVAADSFGDGQSVGAAGAGKARTATLVGSTRRFVASFRLRCIPIYCPYLLRLKKSLTVENHGI